MMMLMKLIQQVLEIFLMMMMVEMQMLTVKKRINMLA
jgi:hypothetical protein